MSVDWKEYSIGEAATVITGKTPAGTLEEDFNGETLFVTPTDMDEERFIDSTIRTLSTSGKHKVKRVIFDRGIAVSCIGWQMGKSAIIRKSAATNQQINTILPNEGIVDFDFVYYVLKQKRKELFDLGSTCTRTPILKKSLFEKVKFKLPNCLKTQKNIAHILGTLDDKIELNRRMNKTLEAMAQTIFKSWFVDFDPVHAKVNAIANGQDPETAAMEAICGQNPDLLGDAEKLRHIASLFPSEFIESELGLIPKGWEVSELKNNINVLNGFAFKSKDYTETGTFVLRTKNFNKENLIDLASDDVFLPDSFLESHEKYLCQPFDYHLIMVGASIGNRGLILPFQLPALRNQNMWCFRPSGNRLGRSYVKQLLDGLIHTKKGSASGSAREFFRKGDFQSQKLSIPSIDLLEEFEGIASLLYSQINNNSFKSKSLSKLRDTLLPKLLSGELSVENAESKMEMV
jgi:type I restriction enzyme, S subunit